MKISTGVDYANEPREVVATIQRLEAAGVDMAWVPEAYGFDGVSLMGYLAASTERITIASGILNTFSRTPTCLAQTAAGLDALSEGRFELGLGASGPQVIEGFHGVPYKMPLTRLKETIEICRMTWKRERLNYEGKVFQLPLPADQGTGLGKPLKMINHPKRDDIPIHVAALGSKSVAATAELCDGWLPIMFIPELARNVWGESLDAGLAQRAPERGQLEIAAGGLLAIGEDAAKYRDYARPMAALYVGGMGARGKNFYNDLAVSYGFDEAAKQIQDLYLDGHKEDAAAAIPAEFVEGFTMCGDKGYIADKVAQMAEAGVTNLMVTPVGGDPAELLGELREIVDSI
ncbi:MAG: LLM class F420-dependent oxidoreductase [Acidimicrobiales bacterium]|nr:LLM class F420-dependent oxidoreductase [Acidimicrobiales bacterium]